MDIVKFEFGDRRFGGIIKFVVLRIFKKSCFRLSRVKSFNIYLRNKETQQTLLVIVSIQYGASFLVQMIIFVEVVSVRQITAGST